MSKTVFTGKWMFTGEEILEDFALLVEDGMLAEVGPAAGLAVPPEARLVELEGFVTPGLIDCHVHLIGSDQRKGLRTSRGDASMICRGVHHAALLLEAGVVACRDLGSVQGYVLGIRDAIEEGLVPGPLVQATGLAACATGGHGGDIGLECDGADEMRKGVRQLIKDGADVVKIMASGGVNSPGPEPGPCELTEEEMHAGVQAAHAMGRKVAIHAHGNSAIRLGVLAGVDSVEHGVFMTPEVMDLMAERGTYLVPTLSAPYYAVEEGLRQDPGNPDHLRSKAVIQQHREMLLHCAEKGVNIAFGTDAGNQYDPFEKANYELVLMVRAGLSPLQALTAATKSAAALMGISQRLGSLQKGREATFLCFLENPLQDIETVTREKNLYLKGKQLY